MPAVVQKEGTVKQMNSCCVQSVDVIAADQHKSEGECCLVTEKTSAQVRAECPISRTSSRRLQRRTLEHLLKPGKVAEMHNVQYYYCTAPDCRVVYFSIEHLPHFTVDDVQVRVLAKDKGDDVHVCYCFDWTRGRIKDEIHRTNRSTASVQIAREVKAGNCTCDIRNPKGECCLGDVNLLVNEILSDTKSSTTT